jgi:hypothetical protein
MSLHRDIYLNVLDFLEPKDISAFNCSSKLFHEYCREFLAKHLVHHNEPKGFETHKYTTFKGKIWGPFIAETFILNNLNTTQWFYKNGIPGDTIIERYKNDYKVIGYAGGQFNGPYKHYYIHNRRLIGPCVEGEYHNGKKYGEWKYYIVPNVEKPQERVLLKSEGIMSNDDARSVSDQHGTGIKSEDIYYKAFSYRFIKDLLMDIGGRVFLKGIIDASLETYLNSENIDVNGAIHNIDSDSVILAYTLCGVLQYNPRAIIAIMLDKGNCRDVHGYKLVKKYVRKNISTSDKWYCYCYIRHNTWIPKKLSLLPLCVKENYLYMNE